MKVMQPLSRLTYATYLVHPIVLFWYYLNLKVPLFMEDITMVGLCILRRSSQQCVCVSFYLPIISLCYIGFDTEFLTASNSHVSHDLMFFWFKHHCNSSSTRR